MPSLTPATHSLLVPRADRVPASTLQVRSDLRELTQGSVTAWLPFNAAIYTVIPLRLRLPAAMAVHFFYSIGLALWEVGALGHRPAAAPDAAADAADSTPALSHPPVAPAPSIDAAPVESDAARERRPELVLDRRSVAAAAAAAASVVVAPRKHTAE